MAAKRFILVPPPFVVIDPVSGASSGFSVNWETFMRHYFRDGRLLQGLDVDDRARVRTACISARSGEVLEFDEDHWRVLSEVAKRPGAISMDWLDSPGCTDMLDAIRNAQTKHPHDRQEKGKRGNGSTAPEANAK